MNFIQYSCLTFFLQDFSNLWKLFNIQFENDKTTSQRRVSLYTLDKTLFLLPDQTNNALWAESKWRYTG